MVKPDSNSDPINLVKFYPPEANLTPDPKNPMKFLNWPSISIEVRPEGRHISSETKLRDLSDEVISTADGQKGYLYLNKNAQCAPKCAYDFELPYKGSPQVIMIHMTTDGDLKLFRQILSTFKFTQ